MTTKQHRSQRQRAVSTWLAALVALTLLATTAISQAAPIVGEYNGVRIVQPGSTVEGKSIAEWGEDWFSWILGQATPGDALTDTTGANAGVNQSGPVYFIAGTNLASGFPATRSFTVPKDRFLLFPLVNVLFSTNTGDLSPGSPESDLRDGASFIADQIDSLTFMVDGIQVPDLFDFRETSPDIFDINVAAEPNVFGADPGPGRAFSDSYYVMVAPLGKGATHEFTFGGGISNFNFTTEVKSTISVPAPGILPLFSSAALALFGVHLRNRSRV